MRHPMLGDRHLTLMNDDVLVRIPLIERRYREKADLSPLLPQYGGLVAEKDHRMHLVESGNGFVETGPKFLDGCRNQLVEIRVAEIPLDLLLLSLSLPGRCAYRRLKRFFQLVAIKVRAVQLCKRRR